jgi:hypothetical protein
MPAARYWRIVGIETYGGGDLELSEVALYDGATRVDGDATLTSTFAPIAGSLANLKDDDTGTTARFAAADVRLPGFALVWDFGSDQNVDDAQFTLPAGAPKVYEYVVEYSSTGSAWTFAIRWRGTFTGDPQVQYESADPHFGKVITLLGGGAMLCRSRNGVLYTNTGGWTDTYQSVADVNFPDLYNLGGSNGSTLFRRIERPATGELSGDFSVETYMSGSTVTNTSTPIDIISFGAGWALQIIYDTAAARWIVRVVDATSAVVATAGPQLLRDLYYTVKWIRAGSENRIVINGVTHATFTSSETISYDKFRLGVNSIFGSGLAYLRALRVTNGVDRGDANITSIFPGVAARPIQNASAAPTTISEYPVPAFSIKSAEPLPLDLTDGGTATITGTVKRYDDPAFVPVARRVRLYNEQGRYMARETWSDPVTGVFTFSGILKGPKYTAMAYDHLGQYRALIIDGVDAV